MQHQPCVRLLTSSNNNGGRNTIMNKTITLGVALILGLAAPALAQQDPIKVGTIFPLSGGAGPHGQSVTNAVKLAIEQLNQAGGFLGRQNTLIFKGRGKTPSGGGCRA